jgi:hypothetical protein
MLLRNLEQLASNTVKQRCSGWRVQITCPGISYSSCRLTVGPPGFQLLRTIPLLFMALTFLITTNDIRCYLRPQCHPWLISIMATNVTAKVNVKIFDNIDTVVQCERNGAGECWGCVESSWNVTAHDDAREGKGKLANGVGNQYYSYYLRTWYIQHYYRWCAHLGCQ